jgi:predicted transcriptional regulator
MANTMEQQLQTYFTQLSEAEKKSVLQLIKTFVNGKKQAEERMSIEQYNREIDEALEDIEKGNVSSHEEVAKMAKDW